MAPCTTDPAPDACRLQRTGRMFYVFPTTTEEDAEAFRNCVQQPFREQLSRCSTDMDSKQSRIDELRDTLRTTLLEGNDITINDSTLQMEVGDSIQSGGSTITCAAASSDSYLTLQKQGRATFSDVTDLRNISQHAMNASTTVRM